VTLFDLETETGMLAGDRRGQFVETFKGVVRDVQIEKGKVQTVRIDHATIGQISQKLDVGVRLVEVVHSFVEARVGGSFDGRAAKVEVVHDLQGAGVSEENTKAGIWDDATVSGGRRANVNPASERAKLCQIWERGTTHFIRARRSVSMGNKVIDADEMVKAYGQKLGCRFAPESMVRRASPIV
jgi:hypothetical protein